MTLRTADRSRQEQTRWANFLRQHGVSLGLLQGLHVGGGSTVRRAKRAAACLLFVSDEPIGTIETQLLQHTPDRSGAGPIRQVAARTRDVIEAISKIASFHGRTCADAEAVDELAVRLETGIPASVLPIANKLGARLSRGQYLGLARAGITDWPAISQAADVDLVLTVGSANAAILRAIATEEVEIEPGADS